MIALLSFFFRLAQLKRAPQDLPATLLQLALLIWAHVAMGHVLRHALDKSLGAGVALAVGVSAASFVVVGNLFPVPMPGANQ